MALALSTRYKPMEASPASTLPAGSEWQYEPKWDGFRCLVFRDNKRLELMSKAGKPLTRYFPELVGALVALAPKRFVLDGEIVIAIHGGLSFDDLLQRIHPAASRILKLSQSHPATLIVFDLLVDERGRSLVEIPLHQRREKLDRFAGRYFGTDQMIRVSPVTTDMKVARKWFRMGIALDGVVAKRRDLPYQSGNRTGMQKIKKQRTADCVVGGFRFLRKKPLVGSLLLGLYNREGRLDHVGFTSSIHDRERRSLTKKLRGMIKPPGFTGRAPGGPSRWNQNDGRSGEWKPLSPRLVVEVQFDHFTGGRFRHGTRFLRWRPDKSPRSCTMAQVERESQSALNLL